MDDILRLFIFHIHAVLCMPCDIWVSNRFKTSTGTKKKEYDQEHVGINGLLLMSNL